MPSTYSSLHYHIVFSTKDRRPTIGTDWMSQLHEYLGGTVRGLDAVSLGVGGVADHVHLLVSMSPWHRVSDLVREVKKASSKWVHDEIGMPQFAWQEGYAAFSVSPTARDSVRNYIARQAEHHATLNFREELVEFLRKADVQYDPAFLD